MKKVILSEEEKKEILQLHSFKRKINESVIFETDGKKYEAWANGGLLYIKISGKQYGYLLEGPFGVNIDVLDVMDGKLKIKHPTSGKEEIHNLGESKLKNILNQIPNKEIEFTSANGTKLTLTRQ
jgi:hypothetical protein